MRLIKIVSIAFFLAVSCYGAVRLYFALTGGFTEARITHEELAYNPMWEGRVLTPHEQAYVKGVLDQPYYYLGKGCQSYVFLSQDGKTVIKFPKYHRFRPQEWIDFFTWIPSVKEYQEQKAIERGLQMKKMFRGWLLGFDALGPETGVIYVHLNKTPDQPQPFTFYDKLGIAHTIDLANHEFMLQKRAVMLESALNTWMEEGNQKKAKEVIDAIVVMVLDEYARGLADNDHALMQNTGIIDDRPIHIDVGQFVRNESVKTRSGYVKGLFNKTFRFQEWLEEQYPALALHLKWRLVAIIGQDYYTMPPYVYRPNFDKLPDTEL